MRLVDLDPRWLESNYRKICGGCLMAALAACTTAPCVPKVVTQTVNVPVPVACINASDIPAEPSTVTLTGDARNDDALLAAKLAAVRVWGRQLVAMLGPCAR